MVKKIKEIIAKLFSKKKIEYVYFFVLDSVTYNDAKKYEEEKLRENLINTIKYDMALIGKEIVFTDLLSDFKQYKTYYILASDSIKTNKNMIVILLEIYAYKSKQQEELFTYKYQKIFSKQKPQVEIFKFEC